MNSILEIHFLKITDDLHVITELSTISARKILLRDIRKTLLLKHESLGVIINDLDAYYHHLTIFEQSSRNSVKNIK